MQEGEGEEKKIKFFKYFVLLNNNNKKERKRDIYSCKIYYYNI
jgi:hypothetical protein